MSEAHVRETKRFFDEWRSASARYGDAPFAGSQLPEPYADFPNITLPRATLLRFRNDYRLLLGLAARLAKVDERVLAPIHLLDVALRPDKAAR